jgi:hypothetical protein
MHVGEGSIFVSVQSFFLIPTTLHTKSLQKNSIDCKWNPCFPTHLLLQIVNRDKKTSSVDGWGTDD